MPVCFEEVCVFDHGHAIIHGRLGKKEDESRGVQGTVDETYMTKPTVMPAHKPSSFQSRPNASIREMGKDIT